MRKNRRANPPAAAPARPALPKSPSGVRGLDQVTGGGLPQGRPTLVCGGPGCGKTLFAMEFLVHGAVDFDEPGVFIAFEETPEDIAANVASLGFDVDALERSGRLHIDHVRVDPSEIQEAGDYDLEGLFVRIAYAVDKVGAKRVAVDTLEALFGAFTNEAVLRAELRRLFAWLKERGLTAVITAERGDGTLTRYGLEEYVSDCVISLDHRVDSQISTRRLRVVKYRGSSHGTNEYPFLIDESGFSVIPITAAALQHSASTERISTGLSGLDDMLGGRGYFRGSTVLVSGASGTGKTITGAYFVNAACRRGERALLFAFEESPAQLVRNMRSVGLDLVPAIDKGLLGFRAERASHQGLEMHLARILRDVEDFDPAVVVVDPLSALLGAASPAEVQALATRLLDALKSRGVTTLVTTQLGDSPWAGHETGYGLSSAVDTWILLREVEANGERNRGLFVLKSRGMAHSNQIREFVVTDRGVRLIDAYRGPDGVLVGSARAAEQRRSEGVVPRRERGEGADSGRDPRDTRTQPRPRGGNAGAKRGHTVESGSRPAARGRGRGRRARSSEQVGRAPARQGTGGAGGNGTRDAASGRLPRTKPSGRINARSPRGRPRPTRGGKE